ncbi:MAG: helix-turn-helix domain-containing protein [Chloroflexota bacterium]|nr:helix-turn-helix domain-containing protein [Chloroflexota bacterium]
MSDRTDERPADNADTGPAAAPDIGGLVGVLSAREAAVALGLSERTVRRAIQRGEIVATKHAGSFQITPAALDDYRRSQAGHRTLNAAAAQDRTPVPAAAPDQGPQRAAAPDGPVSGGDAVAVLRDLLAEERAALAEERAKVERLIEAASVWQVRAVQAEERLKQLTAGDDPPPDAPHAAQEPHHGAHPIERDTDTSVPWWRFWERWG